MARPRGSHGCGGGVQATNGEVRRGCAWPGLVALSGDGDGDAVGGCVIVCRGGEEGCTQLCRRQSGFTKVVPWSESLRRRGGGALVTRQRWCNDKQRKEENESDKG